MNKNSVLVNTLIVYLFIIYLLFTNSCNVNNNIFIILPLIIYFYFVSISK
jgi:hypothetical protein